MESQHAIGLPAAFALGVIEGLTEYLPVSSTGHLILASRAMGLPLEEPGVSAFLIVIQAGAILAVLGLYRAHIRRMALGLSGRDADGLRLALLLGVSFLPAAAIGGLLAEPIKRVLFSPHPVAAALALGGVAMIALDRLRRRHEDGGGGGLDPLAVTWRMALLIGLGQCMALWPGVSRSMATIVSAMLVGMSPRAAAEYSFLLALPTLGAATGYDLVKEWDALMVSSGPSGLAVGAVVSCLVAAAAIKFFTSFLTRRGLAPFGYYRLLLAAAVLAVWQPPDAPSARAETATIQSRPDAPE